MSDQPTANLEELLEQCGLLERAEKIEESMYQLQEGSAVVVVGIKKRALVIISPMFKSLPEGKESAFCHHLLQLNSALGGVVSFAIQPDGWIVLHGGRDIKGMDPEEFGHLLTAVAGAADYFDNQLLDKFYTTASETDDSAAFQGDDDDDDDDSDSDDSDTDDSDTGDGDSDSDAGDGGAAVD